MFVRLFTAGQHVCKPCSGTVSGLSVVLRPKCDIWWRRQTSLKSVMLRENYLNHSLTQTCHPSQPMLFQCVCAANRSKETTRLKSRNFFFLSSFSALFVPTFSVLHAHTEELWKKKLNGAGGGDWSYHYDTKTVFLTTPLNPTIIQVGINLHRSSEPTLGYSKVSLEDGSNFQVKLG